MNQRVAPRQSLQIGPVDREELVDDRIVMRISLARNGAQTLCRQERMQHHTETVNLRRGKEWLPLRRTTSTAHRSVSARLRAALINEHVARADVPVDRAILFRDGEDVRQVGDHLERHAHG